MQRGLVIGSRILKIGDTDIKGMEHKEIAKIAAAQKLPTTVTFNTSKPPTNIWVNIQKHVQMDDFKAGRKKVKFQFLLDNGYSLLGRFKIRNAAHQFGAEVNKNSILFYNSSTKKLLSTKDLRNNMGGPIKPFFSSYIAYTMTVNFFAEVDLKDVTIDLQKERGWGTDHYWVKINTPAERMNKMPNIQIRTTTTAWGVRMTNKAKADDLLEYFQKAKNSGLGDLVETTTPYVYKTKNFTHHFDLYHSNHTWDDYYKTLLESRKSAKADALDNAESGMP